MNYVKSNGFTFSADLCRANQLESTLAAYLEKELSCKAITSQDKLSFKDWDIQLQFKDGTTTTIEVKEDRCAGTTGNVAVELHKVVDGVKQDSCLSSTKSDYYAYFFDGAYHFISTAVLKHLVKTRAYIRLTEGGNGKRAVCALFKKWFFLKKCNTINT